VPPFQKGRSGNPRGRPKGSRNVKTLLREEAGRAYADPRLPEELSKLEALMKALMDNAARGDNRAIAMVLGKMEEIDAKLEAAAGNGLAFTAADREVIAEIWRRLQAAEEAP
jgi:hypothetical protein